MANDLKLQVLLAAIDRVTGPMKKIMGGTSSTAKALRAAKDQLRELDRAQQQLKGFRTLKNEVDASRVALKAGQQQLARLRGEMAATEKPTRKLAAAYARAERDAGKLKATHAAKLRTLRDTRAALAGAGMEAGKLGDHERRLRGEMARTTQVIAKQQVKLDQLGRAQRRMGQAQRELAQALRTAGAMAGGGAAMAGVGATAVAPVLATVKAYASFQDAMTGVARQVDGARDKHGRLTPLYWEMGRAIKTMSERLPGTAEDIAAIVEAGARMGIQGKKNLLIYAETTSVMADAFDLPVDQVGQDVATIAALYKVPIARIGELGDAINFLDDNTLSKGSSIIDVLKRIGGTADMVGMSYRDAAALGSTFLSLGAGDEIAGSASNAMIRELSIATMQAKRFQGGLEMLNLDAAAVQANMSKDATGTILQVLEVIRALPAEQRLSAATRLFGKEFGDDAAKLAGNIGEYRKQLALANSEQARGSMLQEAQARAGNLSAVFANGKDGVRNLASDLGQQLAPAISDLIDYSRGITTQLRAWVAANPQLAGGVLKAAAVGGVLAAVLGTIGIGLASVLGPLAIARYSLVSLGTGLAPLLTSAGELGGRVLPMIGNAARMLLPALAGISAPVLAVVGAVALAGVLIWKYWQPIKAFMVGLWQGISQAAAPVGAMLAQVLAPLKPVWDWFAGVLGKVWGWIKQLLTPFQATSTQLQNATGYGRTFGIALVGIVTGPIRLLIAGVQLVWKVIKTVFAWSPIGLIVRNWDAIMGFFRVLPQRFVEFGRMVMTGLVNGVVGGLAKVRDTIYNAGGKITGWFKEKLGIHSPSRVFAQLGDYTMQGLAGGLDRSRKLPLRALTEVAGGMRRAGAGIALAAAAAPAVAIDQRPPLTAAAAAPGAAGNTYTIHIHAGAGSQAQDIAAAVRAELERLERERGARTRSRLADYD